MSNSAGTGPSSAPGPSSLPSSLPPRPPPSTVRHPAFREAKAAPTPFNGNAGQTGARGPIGFGGFVPRKLGVRPVPAQNPAPQPQPPVYTNSAPVTSHSYPPPIANPYPVKQNGYPGQNYDPEMDAKIAQWQSAYTSTRNEPLSQLPRPKAQDLKPGEQADYDSGVAKLIKGADGRAQTVQRVGGGKTWQDKTLLDWNPAHFRLFVGNLAGEVTDDSLFKAFAKYSSLQKARVVRERRTSKSKGYGFVSFSDGDDFFQAAREMQGKYIGSHPILLSKSTTEIRPTAPQDKKHGKNKNRGRDKALGAQHGSGVKKSTSKTKGGLKILG